MGHRALEQDRGRLRVEVPQPSVIPRSKLGPERIRHRFLRRVAARREEPGPDRLALPAPEGEVVVIEERGIVDAPEAAVERPERGQQQGEGDAAVGDRPEDRPGVWPTNS